MKLLLDENLSPRLVDAISDLYPGTKHVDHAGLGGSDDNMVWRYASEFRFAIVSKDSDFADRSVLDSEPPKVIWIRLGNCSTDEISRLLRSAHPLIRQFLEEDRETCLMLRRASDL